MARANRRVVVIFTDDNPHVPDFGVNDWAEVHSTLRDENVEQVHLFTDQKHEPGYDELDDLGYLVVRHPLVRDDAEALEESIREFIRISSEGGGNSRRLSETRASILSIQRPHPWMRVKMMWTWTRIPSIWAEVLS